MVVVVSFYTSVAVSSSSASVLESIAAIQSVSVQRWCCEEACESNCTVLLNTCLAFGKGLWLRTLVRSHTVSVVSELNRVADWR